MPYKDPEARWERYRELREKALEYLGKKCVKCGSIENLEFDHIDPSTKEFNISRAVSRPWSVLQKELDKCQLLCDICHLEKIKSEKPARQHGTISGYQGGCSCSDCRTAWNKYHREKRASKCGC